MHLGRRSILNLPILVAATALVAAGSGCGALGSEEEITVPEGTRFVVSLEAPLSTAIHRSEETFPAVLLEPLVVEQTTVLPTGTRLRGRLLEAESSNSVEEDGAALTLVIDSVLDEKGEAQPLHTAPIQLVTEDNPLSQSEDVVVSGVEGSVLGGDETSSTGAFLTLAAPDGEIVLRAGQRLRFTVDQATSLEIVERSARAGL